MINFLASIEDLLPLGLDARFFRRSQRGILELADEILRRSGEASGSALALELIEEYRTLNREKRAVLFEGLLTDYGPDPARLMDGWIDLPRARVPPPGSARNGSRGW